MLVFYVLTNDLFYQKSIQKTIQKIVGKKYQIKKSISSINTSNNIYLIDLESEQNLDVISMIREKDFYGKIIAITSKKDDLDFYSYHLKDYILVDKEENYQLQLEEAILSSLEDNKNSSIQMAYKNEKFMIPLEEIQSFEPNGNIITVNGKRKNGQKYTYTMMIEPKNIEQVEEILLYSNSKAKLYWTSNQIVVYSEQKMHQAYSDTIKSRVVILYLKGISVKYLSEKYHISTSAIYSWINKYKWESKIIKLESETKKYKKIEKIVNSK